MRGHQTYSLSQILSANQIRPQLYQQILHDIKSPLEEVSIDLTHDDSRSIEKPRRPNIPLPPPASPLAHLAQVNFSRTYESHSFSMLHSPQKTKGAVQDKVMESVLSPLDQQISMKGEEKGYIPFCGGFIDSFLKKESSFEIQVPVRNKPYKRKPIFENYKVGKTSKIMKTLSEAAQILLDLRQRQIGTFFNLLANLQKQLLRIDKQRQQIKACLGPIYKQLSGNIEYIEQSKEDSISTHRILRRLQAKNLYEMITKIASKGNDSNQDAARQLDRLLASLNQLEQILSDFMQRQNAVSILDMVYETLKDSYSSQPNLFQQIRLLCQSFGCSIQIKRFDIIWKYGQQRQLSRQQFLQGIALNDCIIRMPKNFQQELQTKGFSRNK